MEFSSMLLRDFSCHQKAETSTSITLGREKVGEELLPDIIVDSASMVFNFENDLAVLLPTANNDVAGRFIAHLTCIDRIGDKV